MIGKILNYSSFLACVHNLFLEPQRLRLPRSPLPRVGVREVRERVKKGLGVRLERLCVRLPLAPSLLLFFLNPSLLHDLFQRAYSKSPLLRQPSRQLQDSCSRNQLIASSQLPPVRALRTIIRHPLLRSAFSTLHSALCTLHSPLRVARLPVSAAAASPRFRPCSLCDRASENPASCEP